MLGTLQVFSQSCYYKQELKNSTMQIIDLCPDSLEAIQQAAALLVEGFQEHWPNAWPDLDSALEEVQESFGADARCLARSG